MPRLNTDSVHWQKTRMIRGISKCRALVHTIYHSLFVLLAIFCFSAPPSVAVMEMFIFQLKAPLTMYIYICIEKLFSIFWISWFVWLNFGKHLSKLSFPYTSSLKEPVKWYICWLNSIYLEPWLRGWVRSIHFCKKFARYIHYSWCSVWSEKSIGKWKKKKRFSLRSNEVPTSLKRFMHK